MSVLCPKCGKPGRIKDSRHEEGLVHRRRECCGQRWSTWEGDDENEVVKLRREVSALKLKLSTYQTIISGVRSALGGRE